MQACDGQIRRRNQGRGTALGVGGEGIEGASQIDAAADAALENPASWHADIMRQAAPLVFTRLGDDGANTRIEKMAFIRVGWMEVARVQVLDCAAVAAFPVGDRADHGKLVGDTGVHGQQFTDVEAGNVRLDRLKWSTILHGCVRFGIVGFELGKAAVEPKQND